MEIPGSGGSTVKPPGTENPGGWGFNLEKTLCGGGYGYFLEPHNLFYKCTKVHLVYCIGSKGLSWYQIYQTPVTSQQLPVNNYQ